MAASDNLNSQQFGKHRAKSTKIGLLHGVSDTKPIEIVSNRKDNMVNAARRGKHEKPTKFYLDQ